MVITDLNMPSMNGTTLGAKMLKIRPELRLILATGYSANLDEAAAQKLGFSGLLPKPNDYRKLGEAAQLVLHPRVEQAG